MKVIKLTPQNNASVAGLMRKIFSRYQEDLGAEMGYHCGPHLRKNNRLPRTNDNTRQQGFFPGIAEAKKSGIRITSEALDYEGKLKCWLHFGDTVIINDRKIFVILKNIDSPGRIFYAFVPDWEDQMRQREIMRNFDFTMRPENKTEIIAFPPNGDGGHIVHDHGMIECLPDMI
ncbi:MAG: hypothetical protein ABIO57_02035 [Candidatus Paceibacterota bacterium]